jgi:hypothetical protein
MVRQTVLLPEVHRAGDNTMDTCVSRRLGVVVMMRVLLSCGSLRRGGLHADLH